MTYRQIRLRAGRGCSCCGKPMGAGDIVLRQEAKKRRAYFCSVCRPAASQVQGMKV